MLSSIVQCTAHSIGISINVVLHKSNESDLRSEFRLKKQNSDPFLPKYRQAFIIRILVLLRQYLKSY